LATHAGSHCGVARRTWIEGSRADDPEDAGRIPRETADGGRARMAFESRGAGVAWDATAVPLSEDRKRAREVEDAAKPECGICATVHRGAATDRGARRCAHDRHRGAR